MSTDYKRYQEGLVRSVLARPEEVMSVIDYVDGNDFEDVNLKMVFESILDIYSDGKIVSLAEIANKISESGGAVDTGWLFGLEANMSEWIQTAPPATWAKLLKKESVKHRAKLILKEGFANIEDKESNPLTVIDEITELLSKASVDATSNDIPTMEEAIEEFEEETREIISTGGKHSSVSSAYPTIDYYTGGWMATHLITIGARTGVGKTVFAVNSAVAAMMQEKSVLFFSLEMSRRELISRMTASLAMLPINKIEKAQPLTAEELERQKDALDKIRKSKLKIDTTADIDVDHIKRMAVRQAQSEDGLDFIIIDYLQLISSDMKRGGTREQAVSEVSRRMKILAKELNVPVMVLVQLNRENAQDDDHTPKLYHIRESAAIAQNSNVVILIDRKVDKDTEVIDPKATFIIAKNRQGEADKYITVRTRLESSLFIDDNLKGQELVRNLEASVESEGDYEVNYDSDAYLDVPDEILGGNDSLDSIDFEAAFADYANGEFGDDY